MNTSVNKVRMMGVIALMSLCFVGGNLFAEDVEDGKQKRAPATLADSLKEKSDTRVAPVTLLNEDGVTFSGFGGPVVKFTQMDGDLSILPGLKGGVIINDSFVLGAAGYGLVYPLLSGMVDGLGYGGILVEYYFFPKELLNFSIGIMGGAGGAGKDGTGTAFFVAEPEVNVYANITRFMRLGAGASYRYSNGLNLANFTDKEFSGFSGSVAFEFGWF